MGRQLGPAPPLPAASALRLEPSEGALPHCKVCDLRDFNHPDYLAVAREVFPHEITRFGAHYPRGSEYRKHWEIAMGVRAMRAGGAIRPDSEVLGVGAGNEPTIFWLTQHVRRVFATDLYLAGEWGESANARMLVDPSGQWPGAWNPRRLVVQHMNALDLHYDDETMDAVFSSSSIEHFGTHDDVRRAIDEIFRVLKPGGVLSVSTEFRLGGPSPGFPGVLMFDRDQLLELVVGSRGWSPMGAIDTSVSSETLATIRPESDAVADVERHVMAYGELRFHQLDWSSYPMLALERGPHRWTSVHLALQKHR